MCHIIKLRRTGDLAGKMRLSLTQSIAGRICLCDPRQASFTIDLPWQSEFVPNVGIEPTEVQISTDTDVNAIVGFQKLTATGSERSNTAQRQRR